MRIFLRILAVLAMLVLLIAAGTLIWFNSKFPADIPVQDVKVEVTPARMDRGRYLAEHAVGCLDCHSDRDFRYYSGPIIPGTEGKGGFKFDQAMVGIPGYIYSRNITPGGIGDWTDGELIRTMTCGINKKGEALFPLMPYQRYAGLSKEDLYSLVAYIRSLAPIQNDIPARSLDFPMNFIVRTIPQPDTINTPEPDPSDTLEYGRYLVNAAACTDCHTMQEKGQFVKGMEFAGGFQFTFPTGDVVRSSNITPDKETGIGDLSRENFIAKFKSFVDSSGKPVHIPVAPGQKNTVMPWTVIGGMKVSDLSAIYTFLRSLPPVHHEVEVFTPAPGNK